MLNNLNPTISYLQTNIVGYTGLSEFLKLEDLGTLLQKYHSIVRKSISDNGGQVERIMGDQVYAFWIHQDELIYSTDSVLLTVKKILDTKHQILADLDISIGVATGKAILLENMFIGQVPNNGLRLAQLGKTCRSRCLICNVTNEHQNVVKTYEYGINEKLKDLIIYSLM